MLQKLAAYMKEPPPGDPANDDNETLPAGYTYLAQLVGHDLIHNVLPLPKRGLKSPNATRDDLERDYRTNRLVLETVYGGGPSTHPLAYAIRRVLPRRDFRLRLGQVRVKEEWPEFLHGAYLDIPRARCPHLNDRPHELWAPDALLADPRNDDNLILSQLTALFHELHNHVFERIPRSHEEDDYVAEELAFLEARKVVAYVYRRIIRLDLLPKLIVDRVYRYYFDSKQNFPDDWLFDRQHLDSNRVPIEFSHAAYRFGHILVRQRYDLNKGLGPQPLKAILDRSSSRISSRVPLGADWLVDWSRFFEGQDEGDINPAPGINLARRIRPYTPNSTIAGGDDGEFKLGLFYVDLVRGAECRMRSVGSLIADMAPQLLERYPLERSTVRAERIREWLLGRTPSDEGMKLSVEEIESLATDPPLAFYVLFEAEQTEDGKRLGALGSAIVAEVISAALKHGEEAIENDIKDETLSAVFGATPVPECMAALIRFVHAQRGAA